MSKSPVIASLANSVIENLIKEINANSQSIPLATIKEKIDSIKSSIDKARLDPSTFMSIFDFAQSNSLLINEARKIQQSNEYQSMVSSLMQSINQRLTSWNNLISKLAQSTDNQPRSINISSLVETTANHTATNHTQKEIKNEKNGNSLTCRSIFKDL